MLFIIKFHEITVVAHLQAKRNMYIDRWYVLISHRIPSLIKKENEEMET